MTMGQRVAQKRKEQGLSQEALGDRLGVSRQSIYKWESDSALPEIDKLVALARLFGVSVGWLLGVEEDASPEATVSESGGELTEQQLKMVEEITARYTAAVPKPKKSAWDKWSVRILFAICGLMVGTLFSISGTVKKLEGQYSSLQSNVSHVQNSVDRQIGTITNRVEEILKAQNDLTADYGTEILRTDLASNTITFSLRAVPKTFVEGMTAEFTADNGDGADIQTVSPTGETFNAEITAQLTDSITLSVVFIYPDGTRRTQLLDTYEYLYSESMPMGDVNDELMWKDLEKPGVLVLTEAHERYVYTRGAFSVTPVYGPNMSPAAIKDIRVGLFKNQKLAAWAEPCEQPASYHGFDEFQFFQLPELRLPLAADDVLHVAAVVTDEYGRVTVWSGAPYILDQENMALTWPTSSSLDADPRHWEFE